MLYVFHVDTGTTVTFDIKLALQSVSHLMEAIERECGVMANQQVLLMSGGLSLEPSARVCSYSVGTDTNPIYLFSKANIESAIPPTPSIDYGSDVDLQSQIDASIAMPATYETLVARAHLAQRCCALAREQTRICERLVFDQHLQQQGWATVVANLEDITQSFQSSVDVMRQNFAQYLAERRGHMKLLESFNSDLSTLSKIPILPALRAQAEGILNADDPQKPTSTDLEERPESPEAAAAAEDSDITNEEVLSLLRWIAAKDNQSSLEQVAEQSSRGLEQFDEKFMNYINEEVNDLLELATKKQMKNIHNIDQRLSDLEDRLNQSRQLVHEQEELAQGFQQNQIRASNLGDPSVLPDLCTSHRRQLLVMLQNHNQLRDIRRRIAKAKEELSANLYHRLKWVMYVENRISEVGNKLMMYNESLKRLRRHLEVLQQIHTTPEMYISAVSEVVRRRTFSQAFLIWASNLACQLLTVHNEELERRRDFQNKFDGHFLSSLFPGLEDTPPPFATQAPSSFDTSLPKLTADDMETLKTQLPDLALNVSTPDLNSITQFFLSKSLTDGSMTAKDKAERECMYMNEPTKETDCVRTRMLADRGGFESETDTEEFEKIGQGGLDSKPGSFDGAKQSTRQKQLEENLGNTREEVERLRTILKTMKTVVCEALASIREELAVLRDQSGTNKNDLGEITERVRETLSLYSRECDRRLQEREQELTVDHELEMGDVKKIMHDCNEELQVLKRTLENKETELVEHERLMSIVRQKLEEEQTERRNLQTRLHQQITETLEQARVDKETALKETNDERFHEIASLTASLNLYKTRIQELEEDLAAARADQQRVVKEATDKLQLEFKTELETIRSRFKLMTASNMERSPSDSSLEKIERPDVIELVNHEAILAQTKEDMDVEKSVAVRSAIAKERADCVAKMDHELRLAHQMIEEKNTEVKFYRMREVSLIEECKRYKNTIRRLTKSENLARQNHNDKVENLEADKLWLTSQLGTKMAERKHLEQRDNGSCESERQELRQELPDENLKMSQSGSSLDEVLGGLKSEKSIVEVSESKKVRLEASNDSSDRLTRRLEILENDNQRLERELKSTRQDKETAEAKIDALEADKVRLEVELVKERSRRAFVYDSSSTSSEGRDKEMTASVSVVSESTSSRDAATSPELSRRSTSIGCFHSSSYIRKKLSKKTAKLVEQGQMTVTTCNKGDVVLVLWDPLHRNYTLFQESHTLYFLNSDCIESLNLGLNPDGTPRRLKTLARVVQKEYCHAKKPENRYRVPQGTKFYRVRVNPVEDQIDESLLTTSQQS